MDEFPKEKAADYVYAAARAGASLVPVVGGPLQVVLETVIASPVGKRKDEWMKQLAEVVAELQAKMQGLTPEKLAENDMFVTAVAQASQIAVRTHQAEKLLALRNSVLHAALPNAPAEDQQLMFLRFVDELTPWHLRLLGFFANPGAWLSAHGLPNPQIMMGGLDSVIEHAFSELRGRVEFYKQVVRDLQARGLVQDGQFFGMTMSLQGLLAGRITNFGSSFLKYISED